jgi:hypothetical protein
MRDMNLAASNDLEATPTFSINGHRVSGVKDAEQLRQLILEARKAAIQNPVSGSNDTSQKADSSVREQPK